MLTGNDLTLSEWITSPSGRTGANRIVVDDLTFRVETTSAQTRILAFRIDAGMHRCALGARHTLRTTFGRNTQVARDARANRNVTDTTALAVGATRRRNTRFFLYYRFNRSGCFFSERVNNTFNN
jgi:hypothetical protein